MTETKTAVKTEGEWFEGLDAEAICKKRQGHKTFVVDMAKKTSKCLIPVVTPRFVFGNVPAEMSWSEDELNVIREMIDRSAQQVVLKAISLKKAKDFNRDAFLSVPRLSAEAKKVRETERAAKTKAREEKKAKNEIAKKATAERIAKNKKASAEKRAKRDAEQTARLEARIKALEAKKNKA